MNFHYKQKDGSVFLGKCVSWLNPFRYYHDVVHHPDLRMIDDCHMVKCKRCDVTGYADNKEPASMLKGNANDKQR